MQRDRYLNASRALFAICLALHMAAMFPAYIEPGVAVVTTSQQTAEFICLDVGWAVAALLVLSKPLVPSGVALAVGLGSVETGFLVSDVSASFLISNGGIPGHWLAVAGLMAGFSGALLAASEIGMGSFLPARAHRARALAAFCLAVLAVVAYFPNWESGVTPGYSGNAFLQPGGVMAGALVSALLLGLVVVIASLWQPAAVGAWAIAGTATALASQLVSAYFQSEQSFPASAVEPGQRVALSGYWTADVAAAIGLFALALWGLASLTRSPAPEPTAGPPGDSQPGPPGAPPWAGGGHGAWPARHHWPPSAGSSEQPLSQGDQSGQPSGQAEPSSRPGRFSGGN